MNATFNSRRFALLVKKTLQERQMLFLGLTGLSLLVTLVTYLFAKAMSDIEDAQNMSFIIGLVGGGSFLASQVFGYFNSNAMGASFMTLPASTLEKWLTGILFAGVLYLAIFLSFYRLMDTYFVNDYHQNLNPKLPYYKLMMEQVQIFPYDGFVGIKSFIMFFNFAGAMLLGSLYFNKLSFLKGALVIFCFWFGAFFLNWIIAKSMISQMQNAIPYWLVWVDVNKDQGRIELQENLSKTVTILIGVVVPLILWSLTYFRLKEKEF
ncbi:MAG: hypothetical protein IPP79_21295 [Chitinophagaceae bacterium]|nr:hypothetical protein [Chitinophagaceae bacterium]